MSYSSRLELQIDSRTGERNLKRFEGQLDRTDRAGAGLVGTMGGIARVVGLASAAVGGFTIGRVITETAAFEDSMLGLEAVSRATTEQMRQLEDQARTLGATSMFSAQQAGDAQRFLAQAGFEVNEVLSATPGILQLATAGQMGLAQAADIASNVLGGMRLEVDQLNRVNDVLAATAAGSNTTVSQLGQALSTAAPLAAAAGISIEEAAAAIGVMSDAGIQAERAGTGLQGVIRQLSNVTPQAATALAGYGLSLEQVNVETHGLSAVLATLQQANISTADAFKIFGSEAGAAAQILINGNGRVSEFTDSLGDAAGEAERMANVIGSGLTGSMRGFNSMLSETLISLGRDQGVAGGFQAVLDSATGVLAVYNDMLPEFAEANELTETQVDRIETLAGGFDLLGDAAILASGIFAGRLAGSLGAVALAKLSATRQAVLYQASLASMAGVSSRAAAGQIALGAATRGAAGAMALMGGPLGLLVGAAGLLYVFRDELNLTGQRAGLTEEQISDLRDEMKDMSQDDLSGSLSSLNVELDAATIKAATAREELAKLRSENRGSGALGFGGGEVGAEVSGMQAVAQAQERILELDQQVALARGETASRIEQNANAFVIYANRLDETEDATRSATKATKDAIAEADRFASTLQSLQDRLFPVEAAQRTYREEQEALTRGWNEGTLSADRYTEAMQRLEQAQLSTQTAAGAYGGGGGFGSEIGSRGGVGAPTDPMAGVVGNQDQDYWGKWLESAETAFSDFDQMAANTAESFQRGFGSAFESMIFDSQSLGDAAQNMFEGMARTLVNALGQMAAQWLAYQAVQMAIGKTSEATAIGSAIATGTSIAAAYAPAAAAASLASFGANSVPAMAGMSSAYGLSSTLALTGMAHDGLDRVPREGTWLLDKGERVMNRPQADRLDGYLDRQERGETSSSGINVQINNRTDSRVTAQPDGKGGLTIDVVRAEFARDMQREGPMAKAMQQYTTAERRGR